MVKRKAKTTKKTAKAEVSVTEIFKFGMNFENLVEFMESKVLDAFFGHICRQGDWDLAKQYILNVKEWCQMLLTNAKIDLTFLPTDLQQKIITNGENVEVGLDELLKAISKSDFDAGNIALEKILKALRALYKIRE